MKRGENIFFLICLSLVFLFGFSTFLKTETAISESENRALAHFSHFTVESFIDGSFQDNFESALSDQFPLSEQIRLAYSASLSKFPTFGFTDNICHHHYLELSASVDRRRGTFDCDDYIIYYPESLIAAESDIIAANIEKYNRLNSKVDTYYYFVNDSSVYDFERGTLSVDYPALLKQNLTGKYHFASLDFTDYNDFKQYFYKTDHHWNYLGSYRGYTEIMKLLGVSRILTPTSTGTNHESFFGSHAQNTKNYNYPEEFTYYNFTISDHTTFVNGSPATYGHYSDYVNHRYEYDKTTNYYAYFYGPDEGEIIYDFHQPTKDNLLIISNSFSNAVNELIATSFNRTFILDFRRYETVFHQPLVLEDYIQKNHITKLLFLQNPTFIRESATHAWLEE